MLLSEAHDRAVSERDEALAMCGGQAVPNGRGGELEFGDFGSGYPSDPVTAEFVRNMVQNGEINEHVRRSWKTLDKSNDTCPVRAPTIRSVPEIVFVNPERASLRIRSTPNNKATPSAREMTVSDTVNLRRRRDLRLRVRGDTRG